MARHHLCLAIKYFAYYKLLTVMLLLHLPHCAVMLVFLRVYNENFTLGYVSLWWHQFYTSRRIYNIISANCCF